MSDYRITLSGCDDSTIIVRPLSKQQLAFLTELAAQIEAASEFHCQPTITVEPA